MDFHIKQRAMPAAMIVPAMQLDRKAPGGIGLERHHRRLAGMQMKLNIIAMQMNGGGRIAVPAQFHLVTLKHANGIFGTAQYMILNDQIKGDNLGRISSGASGEPEQHGQGEKGRHCPAPIAN